LAQQVAKDGEEGTHEVRWYSGRMARWEPAAAARRICFDAWAKFEAGERGWAFV
jgi:hypothetical protein